MAENTPKHIWVITEETVSFDTGARTGSYRGGLITRDDDDDPVEVEIEVVDAAKPVEVEKLKREMKGFLQAMREILDEADAPSSKMQLDEVELSVEINGEGQVKLFGVGGKAGGKGAMTLKFKRRQSDNG
ncbi:Pepco domain-containing protein [Aerosakkonema funiforme]|uniref:Pepco domain-containing protein n=1 Tax=Aerosakkonema funiforme FACHB-1375 TaxID=2949571 RepID=A0A926VCE4_9CYAN|nr:hypothetical protein [Aerosakkonema funiforme]MBD2179969.1 hypothetical protein [Aerosakkonema funiforme FACHB-1375]